MTTASLKVGTARSGRAICTYATEDQHHIETMVADCNESDHFDSWAVFQRLAAREARRTGKPSAQFLEYQLLTDIHYKRMTQKFIAEEKARLKLPTSLDVVRFAVQLTEKIFQD
jgi:hypothetical protein